MSLAHTASIRCSPLTILILNPDSLTFFPNAPSSISSCRTPSWVPTESYVVFLIMKKLPKKYPVFFDLSFTRKAENLVCKNVEIIGSVIFVITSKQSILGITVKASSSLDNKCDTASDITEFVCLVSESVNNNNSPVAF